MRTLIKALIFRFVLLVYSKIIKSSLRKATPENLTQLKVEGDGNLIISPHSDDETIGCFGLTCEPSSDNNLRFLLLTESGGENVRFNELVRSLNKSGYTSEVARLGIIDGQLQHYYTSLKAEIKKYILENDIDTVFTTSIFDFHPDHRAAGYAVLELVEEGVLDKVYFYHTNHPINLKYATHYSLLDAKMQKLKLSALGLFETQKGLNFEGLIKIGTLYLQEIPGSKELFICVDRENYKLIKGDFDNLKSVFKQNDYTKSVVHPFRVFKNITFWIS